MNLVTLMAKHAIGTDNEDKGVANCDTLGGTRIYQGQIV